MNPRIISPFIEAGDVAAAILTKQGNIYVGVCIDTACTLGMCAERNGLEYVENSTDDTAKSAKGNCFKGC